MCHKNIPNIHRRIEIRAGVVHMDININDIGGCFYFKFDFGLKGMIYL